MLTKLIKLIKLFGLRAKVGLQAGPAAPKAVREFPEVLPKQCVNFACCSPQMLTQNKNILKFQQNVVTSQCAAPRKNLTQKKTDTL